jgi:uncharacterized membrane protein YfcA
MLAGIVLGNAAAGRVSETLFRRTVLAFLALSSASLLADAAWRHLPA